MKRCLLMIVGLLVWSGISQAQTFMFDNLDTPVDSTRYDLQIVVVDGSDTSQINLSQETTLVAEGAAAMRVDWITQRAQSWGGFSKFQIFHPDSFGVWDFSLYENLVMKYYNDIPSSDPGHVHLRISLTDVSDAPLNTYDSNNAEFWYSFEYILDDAPGWNEIVLPLEDVGPAAFDGMNGFYRTGWSGTVGNDQLDLDKIKGIHFEMSIDAPQDFSIHHGSIIFDALGFSGVRSIPVFVFNGAILPADFDIFTWGESSFTMEEGSGVPDPLNNPTNALKWIQGNQFGNGYTGAGFNVNNPRNMLGGWLSGDSMKISMKAESGVGQLRIQLESGANGKVGINFTPIDDNQWHDYKLPLNEFVYQEGTTDFDTTAVTVIQILAEGTGVAGKVVYIDNWWTGNPVNDITDPLGPGAVTIVTDTYSNLITWLDTPGETGETYNLYYSIDPITSKDDLPNASVVEQGIGRAENTGSWSHLLYSPLGDSTTTYYYAVTAVDAAGNESVPTSTSSPITNTAKGIATAALGAPANFVADGNLGDWAGIQAFDVRPSLGSHIVTNTTIDGDGDLSYKVYLAFDADFMYFAFDATDDVVDTTATNSYEKDSPDLFIGLYNQTGAAHTGYARGDEPDYQLRFLPGKVIYASGGDAVLMRASSADYYWGTKFPIGYVIEGRLSLQELATAGGDTKFEAVEGYRIPFDLSLNDADAGGVREGIMTWSPYNDDNSWSSPGNWMYSWVGDTWIIPVGIEKIDDAIPAAFELSQNYPNPFNPSTTISYSLPQNNDVVLEIYNTLGQKVATLINQKQTAGTYNVTFDASNLATGVYFYRLQSGNFMEVRKMMLLK